MPSTVVYEHQLADGRFLWVFHLKFGRARVCLGRDPSTWDDGW